VNHTVCCLPHLLLGVTFVSNPCFAPATPLITLMGKNITLMEKKSDTWLPSRLQEVDHTHLFISCLIPYCVAVVVPAAPYY
jgi:hypothetical protein